MKRQLQIKNGVAFSEWRGTTALPIPPWPIAHEAPGRQASADKKSVFIDVTDREDVPPLGSTYDWDTDTFTPPPPPPDYGVTVGPREFMQLFTSTQRKAIRQAAKTDTDVEDFMLLAQVPEPIRLKHPTTLAGLDLLVAKGLLTRADVTRITEG